MKNEITCLKNLEKNLEWFTLEFNFTQEENPEERVGEVTEIIITQSNYEPYGVFEDMKRKGLYHVYCRKKQNA